MRRRSLRWVRQWLAHKRTAKAFRGRQEATVLEAMGLTSKGLERSQAARKGERFGFRKGMALRTVRTRLMGRKGRGQTARSEGYRGRISRAKGVQMIRQSNITMLSRCKIWLVLSIFACLAGGVGAQQGCDNCTCAAQWQTELVPPNPERIVVNATEHSGENSYCARVIIPPLCLDGFEGIRVTGSGCENLDWGYDFWIRDTIQSKRVCLPAREIGPCTRYWRRIENVIESQSKIYRCLSNNGQELCRETRERVKYFFVTYDVVIEIPGCRCVPLPIDPVPLPVDPIIPAIRR